MGLISNLRATTQLVQKLPKDALHRSITRNRALLQRFG